MKKKTIAFLGLLSFLAAPAAGEDWPAFRGNARRTGKTDAGKLPARLEKKWVFTGEDHARPAFDSSPALAGGLVIAGLAEQSALAARGRIVAVDAGTGRLKWEFKTKAPVFSSPAVVDGRVFAGEGYHHNQDCSLYCLDAANGEEVWAFPTRSHIESSPFVDKDRVTFGAGEDGIYCVNARDGKEVWHLGGEHVDISPLASSGFVFAGTGYEKSAALCLTAAEGKVAWRTPLDLPVWGSPVLLGNRVFFGLGNGNMIESAPQPRGRVVCLAATSGKLIWGRDLPDAVLTAIAFGDDKVFAGCRDGHLYALRPESGDVLWKVACGSPVVASPLVGEGSVGAVGVAGKLVLAASATGEELSSFDLTRLAPRDAPCRSSPAAAGGRIVLGVGGVLVCLGAAE
jgi:outer membrane protein assembly factor BamB